MSSDPLRKSQESPSELSQRLEGVNDLIGEHPRLVRLRRLTQKLNRDLSARRAADIVGLDRSYFSSLFHRSIGLRYTEWISLLRVTESVLLLRDTQLSIDEVAKRVGYRERRTFQRAFKRCVGIAPGHYRALLLSGDVTATGTNG